MTIINLVEIACSSDAIPKIDPIAIGVGDSIGHLSDLRVECAAGATNLSIPTGTHESIRNIIW